MTYLLGTLRSYIIALQPILVRRYIYFEFSDCIDTFKLFKALTDWNS